MSNYYSLPISGENVRGGFEYTDEPRRLSPEDNEVLAQELTQRVELGHRAVWFSPLIDGRSAFVDRQPLMIGDRRLRYIANSEGAIFPRHD